MTDRKLNTREEADARYKWAIEDLYKDDEAVQAFARLSRYEGIIPAIESSHAVAYLEKLMPTTSKEDLVVVNISGRGDKDTERLLQLLV